MRSVAFIPARSGSKRIPHKNIAPLCGHPMLAYTIRAAIESSVFDAVICATDSSQYADIARYYGAEVPCLRDKNISGDQSPDIEWVSWILRELSKRGRNYDVFSILRPTSPFRLPTTIQRAWEIFFRDRSADSLRAVKKCKEHPGKMWVIRGRRMTPILPYMVNDTPWHSSQYTVLPEVYTQDASLEIAWSHNALDRNNIAGETITPFVSEGLEGFDINEPVDLILAGHYVTEGKAELPKLKLPPFSSKTNGGKYG